MRHQVFCVHADTPYNDQAIACGKPVFRRLHGWLCLPHYRAQQEAIPAPQRKSQPRYLGLNKGAKNDDQVVADIIMTDTRAIAEGTIVKVRFGAIEPDYIRYLEAPTVH